MPQCFKFSFGTKTTVIIDCFEMFCVKPTTLLARAQQFSSYKHHNTVKVLLGITPQGCISFVSEAWKKHPVLEKINIQNFSTSLSGCW